MRKLSIILVSILLSLPNATSAQAINFDNFDVLGVKIGMNKQQVHRAVTTSIPIATKTNSTSRVRMDLVTDTLELGYQYDLNNRSIMESDHAWVNFTPDGNFAAIHRHKSFAARTQQKNTLLQALKDKYGNPSGIAVNGEAITLTWSSIYPASSIRDVYRPLPGTVTRANSLGTSLSRCSELAKRIGGAAFSPPDFISQLGYRNSEIVAAAPKCGKILEITVFDKKTDFVSMMQVSYVDFPAAIEKYRAYLYNLTERADKAKQEQLNRTAGNKPKL